MSFLKSSRPCYSLKLPLTNQRVEYSAFTVRSERTLMLASMGGDMTEIINAVINTVNDHVQTKDIRAEDLPQCEVELLLLNLRAKSVGESLELQVTDSETGNSYPTKLDLREVTINVSDKFKDKIELSNGMTVCLKIPSMRTLEGLDNQDNEFDYSMSVLSRCLQSIVVDDECYAAADLSQQEISDFFLDLSPSDFNMLVSDFLLNMPRMSHTVQVARDDGSTFEAEISGLANFL